MFTFAETQMPTQHNKFNRGYNFNDYIAVRAIIISF